MCSQKGGNQVNSEPVPDGQVGKKGSKKSSKKTSKKPKKGSKSK